MQMNLGQLSTVLSGLDGKQKVYIDDDHHGLFYTATGKFHSFRGYYSDIAIEPVASGEALSVAEFINEIQKTIGSTFCGHKGGEYTMNEHTPVWIASPGSSSDKGVIDVSIQDEGVFLIVGVCD